MKYEGSFLNFHFRIFELHFDLPSNTFIFLAKWMAWLMQEAR